MKLPDDLPKGREDFKLKAHISTSDLTYINRSPYHYVMNRIEPIKPTPAMVLGNVLHTIILEPELFDRRYFHLDDKKRPSPHKDFRDAENKLWKEIQRDKNVDKIVVSNVDMEIAIGIKDNVYKDKFLMQLFDNLKFEHTIEWNDEDTGLKLHSRLDGLIEEQNIIVELKSTLDASTMSCIREIKKHLYHVKAAFQIRGAEIELGKEVKYYIFLFVEKKYPYHYNKIMLSSESISEADLKLSALLEDIAECRKTNVFPSYEKEANNELGLVEVQIY